MSIKPIIFPLNAVHSRCADAQLHVASYGDGSPAWSVIGDCGEGYDEPIGIATVCLDTPPPVGQAYVRITPEYGGYLESLCAAGLCEDTGKRMWSGRVKEYAAVVRILRPELDPRSRRAVVKRTKGGDRSGAVPRADHAGTGEEGGVALGPSRQERGQSSRRGSNPRPSTYEEQVNECPICRGGDGSPCSSHFI